MGLFDRLFGKKKLEKVLPSSEEVTESTEVEELVKEEPTATQNDKEEQKIADMEAYYQELKARIRGHSSTCFNRCSKKSRQRNLLLKK